MQRIIWAAGAVLCAGGAVFAGPPCDAPFINQPPRGLYCSCPPTNAVSHSVMVDVAAKDFVERILVRVAWKDLQTGPTTFNWTLLDNELVRARQNNTKVALGIVNGPSAPTWLATQGAQMFAFTTPQGAAATMPVPWDPTYLAAWTGFISQLGARYNGDDTITLVHATHSSANGFEMQLPFWGTFTTQWNSIGYNTTTHSNSWITVVDAFALAFPDKPLDVEIHPVLSSDVVAQNLWNHLRANHPERFGLFAAWWSQSNSTGAYPGMFALIQQAAGESFGTVQLVTNATSNPNGFGTGGIAGAFDLAFDNDVRYAEVWNNDLLNTSLETLLRSNAARFADKGIAACRSGALMLQVTAAGTGLQYQWERESAPGSGVFASLIDGPTASWDGGAPGVGGIVTGATTPELSLAADSAGGRFLGSPHAGRYRCVVSNACGAATSLPHTLSICTADFNCSGTLTVQDIFDYLEGYFGGQGAADINGGGVTVQDLFDFLAAYFAGCPE